MSAKQQILEAAIKLFSKKGFSATSVREIAAAASVNLAMVNYYFRSKDQLLEKLMQTSIETVLDYLEGVAEMPIPELEKVDRIIDLHAEYIFTNKDVAIIFFQEQMASSHSTTKKLLDKLTNTDLAIFESIVASGVRKGVFAEGINAKFLYASLFGTLQQMIYINKDNFADDEEQVLRHRQNIVAYLKTLAKKILLKTDTEG